MIQYAESSVIAVILLTWPRSLVQFELLMLSSSKYGTCL